MCAEKTRGKRKKIFLKIAVGLSGIVVFLFFAFIVFFAIVFCCGDNSYKPDIYKGDDARVYIENYLSFPVPDSAENLYFVSESWLDVLTHISMTIPNKDAWKLIKRYSGKNRSDFKKVTSKWEVPEIWRDEELKSLLILKIIEKNKNVYKCIIYDERTMRLFIRYSSY